MSEPKKRMNKYLRNGIWLMMINTGTPVIIQIIVEQVKGPGYGATAAEIMIYVIIALTILGYLSVLNLSRAIVSTNANVDVVQASELQASELQSGDGQTDQ